MLHLKKSISSIIKRTPLLCGLLFAAVLALLPITGQAQCKSWEAGREMSIVQPGAWNNLYIQQDGSVITGNAQGFQLLKGGTTMTPTNPGKVDGSFDGNNFSIQIFWRNGDTGVYIGKVLPSGRLDGEGYEKRSPNVRVPWHSDGLLKCAPPPPLVPKPIKASGRAKPAPQPPAPPKPPFVLASQSIFPTPYVPTGFVVLTWDGGPDHPNAELWHKTPGGAYAVAKQTKGGLQVTVERGRHYEYMLTEAGKILAGVTFVAY